MLTPPQWLETQISELFRYGHGWPALLGVILLLLLYTLGCVKVCEIVENWWTVRSIRREIAALRIGGRS